MGVLRQPGARFEVVSFLWAERDDVLQHHQQGQDDEDFRKAWEVPGKRHHEQGQQRHRQQIQKADVT
jgi:hypothetical protein